MSTSTTPRRWSSATSGSAARPPSAIRASPGPPSARWRRLPIGAVLDPAPSGVGSSLSLGAFTFKPNPAGVTTYDNTPFYLSVTVNSVNGNTQAANPSTYILDGFFSGTVTATGARASRRLSSRRLRCLTPSPRGRSGASALGVTIPSCRSLTSIGVSNPGGIPAGGFSLTGGIVTEYAAPEPASWAVLALLWSGASPRSARGTAGDPTRSCKPRTVRSIESPGGRTSLRRTRSSIDWTDSI